MASKKRFDRPALVREEVYDTMIILYCDTPKKDKKNWKYKLTWEDGSKSNVYYEDHLYICTRNGIRYAIIGEESIRKSGVNYHHPGHDEFRATVENNATGKHTPKNHPISVPTKAGEPVRG